jgi:CubicO group peptidase (beta-lactamase class C family)
VTRDWLPAALDYLPRWIAFQLRLLELPGCVVAAAHQGRTVLETALGHADLRTRAALTPRHRFRVASHSKTFTAAGIMKLRERGALRLDDEVGTHVRGLHAALAGTTLTHLLSHSSCATA